MLKFKPIYRIAAKQSFKEGLLTQDEYDKVLETLRWPIRVHKETKTPIRVLDAIQTFVYLELEKENKAINWDAILQWLKENWLTILKLIISLLVILDPPPKER